VKIDLKSEGMLEGVALLLGLVPTPMGHTQLAFIVARAIMAGVELGIFDALRGEGGLTVEEVAKACGTDAKATRPLLGTLASAGYLKATGSRFELTPLSRRWMLGDSRDSLRDKMLFQLAEWDWTGQMERFVRTGKPVDMHRQMTPEQWALYQRAMSASVRWFAPEVARRTPVPKGATRMLDIGGSHGLYSVALCRRHPGLSSTILDLPEAIETASVISRQEEGSERVTYRAGNALTDDLGESAYDVVFAANVLHHFTDEENRALAGRVARALKPGGVFVIQDFVRPSHPGAGGQLASALDLYFALTSASGTWSLEEMAAWQRQAGLEVRRPIVFRTMPGTAQQVAAKAR
jgi:2-polyprenyl-3-methyl-5-hydroxy-6-metoxy-1,4-benzoquinol methylase